MFRSISTPANSSPRRFKSICAKPISLPFGWIIASTTGMTMTAAMTVLFSAHNGALISHPAYRQSVYVPIMVGSSVTAPAESSFTLTPIRAESEPQPTGAHPEVQRVPLASDSEMVNGMLCSAKNRTTSAFFVPIFSRSWASSLMFSTCRVNAALSFLQSV